MKPDRELAVTVLWLRNHIEVGEAHRGRTVLREQIIQKADAILAKHGEVSVAEYGEFIAGF